MAEFCVDDCNVQIHSDGSRATVYRVATGCMGRGFVAIDDVPLHLRQYLYAVPGNDWRDAFFRSRQAALTMVEWLTRRHSSC
jgi:hypothetical protein